MKLVIDIPEEVYKCVMDGTWCGSLYDELKNGVPVEPEKHTEERTGTHASDCIRGETHACDCISREAVLEKAINVPIAKVVTEDKVICRKIVFVDDIQKLPPVTPERKMGKWMHMVGWWECNQCHAEYTDMPTCMGKVIYEYCPMCGAKMEVDNG